MKVEFCRPAVPCTYVYESPKASLGYISSCIHLKVLKPYIYLVSCQLNLVFFGAAEAPTDSVKHTRTRRLMADIAIDEVYWISKRPLLIPRPSCGVW